MHWKDWCWSWNSSTLATWCKELSHLKRPWCEERLKVGREGDKRGWDGWMASLAQWAWVWVNSRCWWWTGNPGMLQSMGSQRAGHDWATELNWCEELTHWKRPWCWERLKARGEGDDRGWDGWMASPTLWTWVWANSGSWWWTGKPGVLQSVGSQRVRHDWATELIIICLCDLFKNKILIINSVLEYNLFLEKKSCILKWFLLMYGFWKQVWEVEAT